MDNTLEKIYSYVYVTAYAVNALAIIIWCIGYDGSVSIWFPLTIFGIATLITFIMGRLVQERFDNTLQMYLIVISAAYFIAAFIPPYKWHLTLWEAIISIGIFAAAFFLDGIFEAEWLYDYYLGQREHWQGKRQP